MTVLFLIALAILVQAYLGYPLSLMMLRTLLGDRSRHARGDDLPAVSLVISAYNEELVIRRKIENSRALDYPEERLEIIVVSDGSTDRTEAIVRDFESRNVGLRAFKGRQGKVACLNRVIPDLRSDLVVMSDANSMYEPGSLRQLVSHFVDPRIGCVCGRLRYVNPQDLASGRGELIYWAYEGLIKRLESSLGSLLGANGAIYAFRRTLFRPVDPLMFCDDVIPGRIALEGYLTIYDPRARCEEVTAAEKVERHRRARHASFGLRSMLHLAAEALRSRRFLLAYQCISHRILRWAGGLSLGVLLVSSVFLPDPWRAAALAGQGVFYGAAGLGFLASRLGARASTLYLPYYFLVINLAGLAGLRAFLLRADSPFWEPRQ